MMQRSHGLGGCVCVYASVSASVFVHDRSYGRHKLIRCIHLYTYVRPWLLQPTPSPPRDGFIPQPTPSPPRDGLNPTIATATAVYPLSVVAPRRNRSNTIESLLGVGVDLTRQSRRSCHADVRFAPIYLESDRVGWWRLSAVENCAFCVPYLTMTQSIPPIPNSM
jgi:hypothetical protein